MLCRATTACAITLAAIGLGTGCRKAAPAPGAGTASPDQAPSASDPAGVATVITADNGDPNAALGQLSLQLRLYVLRSRRAPTSFEDFLSSANVQAPSPPDGKKYAIDHGAVILVKR